MGGLQRASWFDGRSSRAREVLVALEPGARGPALLIHPLAQDGGAPQRFEHRDVQWPDAWGRPRAKQTVLVYLHENGSLKFDDAQAWWRACTEAGLRPGLATRMQRQWPVLAAVLLVSVAGLFAFYRYGTPWAAARLSAFVPLAWEQRMSDRFLEDADRFVLKPSKLPEQRRAELRARFVSLVDSLPPGIGRYRDYKPAYTLLFRRGIGPNAFALPGGLVVLTDELVELAAQRGMPDEAIDGVLAHEIGHVAQRHGTRLLVEQGVLQIGLGVTLGDVSGVVAAGSTLLTGLAYRRQHETESDCFALAALRARQQSAVPMADLLLALEGASRKDGSPPPGTNNKGSGKSDQTRPAPAFPDWLRTHPQTHERAMELRNGTSPSCRG